VPQVSILLPCRNAAAWLPECIRSLETQTLRDYEVLAVNDRSTDGTDTQLRDWSERDRRVRVFDIEARGDPAAGDTAAGNGLPRALGVAIAASRAPLLARMDADDVAHPTRLEAQRTFLLERPHLAACGTGVELFPRAEVGEGYLRYEAWLNGLASADDVWRDLLVECPVAHPTLMIRRSVLSALGGYRDAGWAEDYDLVLRLHAAGMRLANVRRKLVRWRVRPDRHSLQSDRYSARSFRRCRAHFLAHAFLPGSRPLVVWGAGKVGKPLARELIECGLRVDAFVDLDARKIGQRIHGAPVLDPGGFESLLGRGDPYVLAAVGSPGARDEIRQALAAMGRREIEDYRACA